MNADRPSAASVPLGSRSKGQPVKPVVVYDGTCGFCQRGVARIQTRDKADQFEYCPRDDPSLEARFPAIAQGDFNTGMRFIDTNGRIHQGADAVYAIARRLPYWRRVAWLYRVPGIHAILRALYRWVAANRQRLPGSCPVKNFPATEARSGSDSE